MDPRQLGRAQQLCRDSIAFLEQQLGLSALRPPGGTTLIRRLGALRTRLEALQEALADIEQAIRSQERTPPH